MDPKTKSKIKIILSFVILAVVIVVAVILWIIGIMSHQEAGLLRVCWAPTGQAVYVNDEVETRSYGFTCEGSQELRWPTGQIPITIATTDQDGATISSDSPRGRILERTIRDLNSQVGFALFRWIPEGTVSADAVVYFGEAIEARNHGDAEPTSPPGYVTHNRAGNALVASVHIRSDVESSDELLFRVLQHELLHIAGLAHDEFELSIMYPITRDELSGPMSAGHVTDVDRDLLRSLYAGE